jgi:hypothetical protein
MKTPMIGWTMIDCAIRPGMFASINLGDFRWRPPNASEKRRAVILYSRPEIVVFEKLTRPGKAPLLVSSTEFVEEADMRSCRIEFDGGGSIIIRSEDHQIFMW